MKYSGDASIDGVPGTAAPILLDFLDIAGSSCGALLPTGNPLDVIEDVEVTLIDNGMPVVVMRASDLGKTGAESPAELEADKALKARVEAIRLEAGPTHEPRRRSPAKPYRNVPGLRSEERRCDRHS